VLIFIFFVGFIFIHPYLASLGDTRMAHYKAMITGYEDVEGPAGGGAGADATASER
jgi:hypothetical protein